VRAAQPAARKALLHGRPLPQPHTWRTSVALNADNRGDVEKKFDGVLKTANGMVDGVVDLVPESVSRGTARIAVIGGGLLLAFTLLQKIVSTVFTLAILAAAAYYFVNMSGGEASPRGEDIDAGDADDPVNKARKIMDKYK